MPCERTPVGRVGEDLQDEVVDVFIANLGHHIQWRRKLLLSMTMMMMLSMPMLLGTSTLTTQEFIATRLLNVRRRRIYTCVREGGATDPDAATI